VFLQTRETKQISEKWRDGVVRAHYSFLAEGCYDATEEWGIDGRVVYRKRGDSSIRIQHLGGLWEIRRDEVLLATIPGGCGLPTSCRNTVDDGCTIFLDWRFREETNFNGYLENRTYVYNECLFVLFGAEAEHFFLRVNTFTLCLPTTPTPDTHSRLL
jgi:hypothetical protein